VGLARLDSMDSMDSMDSLDAVDAVASGTDGSGDGEEGSGAELRMPHFGLAVICFILFLTFLDSTVISATLSDVQSGLHAGVAQLQ
jgi:hypothetical protein